MPVSGATAPVWKTFSEECTRKPRFCFTPIAGRIRCSHRLLWLPWLAHNQKDKPQLSRATTKPTTKPKNKTKNKNPPRRPGGTEEHGGEPKTFLPLILRLAPQDRFYADERGSKPAY